MNFLGYVLGFIIWTGFSMAVAFGLAVTIGYDSGDEFKRLLGISFAGFMVFGGYLFVCAYWQGHDRMNRARAKWEED